MLSTPETAYIGLGSRISPSQSHLVPARALMSNACNDDIFSFQKIVQKKERKEKKKREKNDI